MSDLNTIKQSKGTTLKFSDVSEGEECPKKLAYGRPSVADLIQWQKTYNI